jgi:hypothetical protein
VKRNEGNEGNEANEGNEGNEGNQSMLEFGIAWHRVRKFLAGLSSAALKETSPGQMRRVFFDVESCLSLCVSLIFFDLWCSDSLMACNIL